MTLRSISKVLAPVVACALATTVVLAPSTALADGTTSPTGKGIAGGALLGAEAVVTVEAIAGVQSPWAYAIGAVVGAGGGGVGGYFAEKGSDGKVPLYLLAAGMAFAIPATILALNATSYHPGKDYQEDKAPPGTEAPADVPTAPKSPAAGQTGMRLRPPTYVPAPTVQAPVRPMLPMSLVDIRGGDLRLGIPAVEVRPLYTAAEMRQLGLEQKEEIRVPVFHAVW